MYENFWDVLDLDNGGVIQLIALAKIRASCTWESTLLIFQEYEIGKPYSNIAYISSLFLPIAGDAEPGLP